MSDDLGFATPTTRRDLASLRAALAELGTGDTVTATFHVTEHGRFTVSGPVRRDLTDTAFRVGWWDLTSGKGTDPVPDLQVVTPSPDDASPADLATEVDDLRDTVDGLEPGDVVTAGFEFEGCGAFTITGGVRRDESGSRWLVAGHLLSRGGAPAPRLRALAVVRRTPVPVGAGATTSLFA